MLSDDLERLIKRYRNTYNHARLESVRLEIAELADAEAEAIIAALRKDGQ